MPSKNHVVTRISEDRSALRAMGISAAWMLVVCSFLVSIRGADDVSLPKSEAVLTNLAQVRGLNPKEAALGQPVRVQGVVTFYYSNWHTLFVEDETAGIFVAADNV